MSRLPFFIFFLSGSAALIFETLWFRLAGLNVGNSVWGAAVVLAGFMGGLGLGNWLVSRHGHLISKQIYFYVVLEVLIGTSGLALVMLLPELPKLLTPVFQLLLDQSWLLNSTRMVLIYSLLLVPSAAMGATLPIMVKAVCNIDKNFGAVLGKLYGWNTLGAVSGVLLCEFYLIEWLGIRNAGFVAVVFNLLAIALALRFQSSFDEHVQPLTAERRQDSARHSIPLNGFRILAATFLIGLVLLALEVVWFRFLLLTISGTSVIFALMLVIVLTGIGLGGLIASLLYKKQLEISCCARELAFAGGICTVLTYVCFDLVYFRYAQKTEPPLGIFVIYASFLMLPIAVISGMLFTTLGRSLERIIPVETRAVGLLTLSNTVGAMTGALLAGLVLLTTAGMERSFWLLAILFGLAALLIPVTGTPSLRSIKVYKYAAPVIFFISIIFFPFGLMQETHFQQVFKKWGASRVAAVKEGLVATNFYYVYEQFGKPKWYRLMTNGHSMSGTSWIASRYMKLFVFWPVALNPDMKNALLISYGVGTTAKALTDVASLKSIDIVDISRDVLEMSEVLYPDPDEHPLNDERVNVNIEDGRFYLQTTAKKYDLITGEPPPPKMNQVVNLYTQEYFQLIYDHLSEGGLTTYWLPVYQLRASDSRSIIKAFCNVFPDCSLWTGAGLEWMLAGSKNNKGPGSADKFSQQWYNPGTAKELKNLGIEEPALLGSMFLADSVTLKAFLAKDLPVTDNYPKRLSTKAVSMKENTAFFYSMMDIEAVQERFKQSTYIKQILPAAIYGKTLDYFDYQRMISDVFLTTGKQGVDFFRDLHKVLLESELETLPLWMLESNYQEQAIIKQLIAEGQQPAESSYLLAKQAISTRNYAAAIQHLDDYLQVIPESDYGYIYPLYLYLLCMDGRTDQIFKEADKIYSVIPYNDESADFYIWLKDVFGVDLSRPNQSDPDLAGKTETATEIVNKYREN